MNTENNTLTLGTIPTTAGTIYNDWGIKLSESQLFAKYLKDNPLIKEGFKSLFSGFIREEFVKQTEAGKEVTNEDLRNIADKAAENFTEYLCRL